MMRGDDRTRRRRKNPQRLVLILVSIALLIAGLAVLAYPSITRQLYRTQAEGINAGFIERMEQYTKERRDELYERMLAYNRALYEGGQNGLVDAFSYEQVDFSLVEFGFEEEMIGYLSIPALDLELPIYLGASRENLNRGAAHLSKTSLPIGGNNSNAVIAAHRGMPTTDMFRHIDHLEVGDPIYIRNYREQLEYEVVEIAIILPHEIDKVMIQAGRDMVTLVTCHPYGQNKERYVVYAQRTSQTDEE